MIRCKHCGSYAINLGKNGRDDRDSDVCDVCHWKQRAEMAEAIVDRLQAYHMPRPIDEWYEDSCPERQEPMSQVYPIPILIEMLREPCGDEDCGHCGIERQAADEIKRLQTILSTPPTWLCEDCRQQWLIRDAAEKQVEPDDNRNAAPLPPLKRPDGTMRCPGKRCAGLLNRHTPPRCPDCLQPLERTK